MLKRKLFTRTLLAGFATLGITINAMAACPGVYLGAQLGWSNTHWDISDIQASVQNGALLPLNALVARGAITSANVDSKGLAGRAFLGYQFNDYWAAEFGYSNFNNTTYRNVRVNIPTSTGFVNLPGSDRTIDEYAVDAVAKGILPLGNCFGLYGKLGAAYINAQGKGNLNHSDNHIGPTFGIGLSYDVTPNIPVDVSWNRIQKVGGSRIPSTDLVTLGVGYHFG